jgi:plastocyanin
MYADIDRNVLKALSAQSLSDDAVKRYHLSFLVSLALAGFLFLSSSVQSLAADVKFACSHHGPAMMSLTLTLEQGAPRTIVIEGKATSGMKWFVTIDNKVADSGNGGDNGDTITVHSGDTIMWILTGANHGVAFADKDVANAMLKDLKAGATLQLEDLTTTLTTDDWVAFGATRWGVKKLDAVAGTIIMVTGTVK